MKRKKEVYHPKSFESTQGRTGTRFKDNQGFSRIETTANIFESMLTHPKFIALKPRLKVLYLYLKAQYYGKHKPQDDYKDLNLFQGGEYFYFNWAVALGYGLYKESMRRDFYRDMQELERNGFIKKVSSGQTHKKKNIYKFSDEWHKE